ncbi:MAG: DUF1804 family protein [Burkholderiales bacterium]|jgi:hypothetical protein|nr:DUF1804 family protein [Burkholderiales bacterium]
MAYNEAQRHAIRAAYVYQRKTVMQLAKLHRIPERTLARWKKDALKQGDDWDVARTAYSISAKGSASVTIAFLEDFMIVATNTMKELKEDPKIPALGKAEALSRLSDSYNKAMAAANKYAPELNKISVALEVLHDLAEFVRNKMPEHAAAMLEVLEPFGAHIAKKY